MRGGDDAGPSRAGEHQAHGRGGGLRVAYVTAADPSDRRAWSGTHFRIIESLKPNVREVVALGPLDSVWRLPLSWGAKVSWRLLRKRYAYDRSPLIAADHGRQIERKLRAGDYDVILAPAASSELSTLSTKTPIVYFSDATFALMRDYYPKLAAILRTSQEAGERNERMAIRRSARVIYPSRWAAQSAIDDYQAEAHRIVEVPLGANFEIAPVPRVRVPPREGRYRLLFVGKDWVRKGGPIALEALQILRARGRDATLTVVGCDRPEGTRIAGCDFIPNIDKRDPGGENRLRALYEDADLFVLPTRAECFGIVFCEAAAYGLPIVATATGGVPSAVAHGRNGYLLPLDAGAVAYADLIDDILCDSSRYIAMAAASRALFEQRLNWDAFGRRTAEVLQDAVENPNSRAGDIA